MTVAQPQMCQFVDVNRWLRCKFAYHTDGAHHLVGMTDAEVKEWGERRGPERPFLDSFKPPQMCQYKERGLGLWLKCKFATHTDNKHHLVPMTDEEDGSVPTAPLDGKTGLAATVQKRLDEFYALGGKAGRGMVGGTHYKQLVIDPWMVIEANGMGYFDGNALKYIMRFRHKDGLQDLKKAQHYLEKLIAMETAALPTVPQGFCGAEHHRDGVISGTQKPHPPEDGCIHWSVPTPPPPVVGFCAAAHYRNANDRQTNHAKESDCLNWAAS